MPHIPQEPKCNANYLYDDITLQTPKKCQLQNMKILIYHRLQINILFSFYLVVEGLSFGFRQITIKLENVYRDQ